MTEIDILQRDGQLAILALRTCFHRPVEIDRADRRESEERTLDRVGQASDKVPVNCQLFYQQVNALGRSIVIAQPLVVTTQPGRTRGGGDVVNAKTVAVPGEVRRDSIDRVGETVIL